MKKIINPDRMIQTIQEYFKGMYYHNKKSGYRCSSYYNTSKEFSLIRVIKEKLRDSWIHSSLEPFWTLDNACFYEV
jgi:hypothetical protein